MSRKTGPGPFGWLMYLCASLIATALIQHKHTPFEYQVLGVTVSGVFAVIGRTITRGRSGRIQRERDQIASTIYATAIEGRVPPRFFLYLRPFSTTARLNQGITYPSSQNPHWWVGPPELEQVLANVLSPYGQLIGLGGAGDALGSGHAEVDDAEWKQGINALLTHCKKAFIVPGTSEGTMWEISTIRARPAVLERTIFIMPSSSEDFPVQEHWEAAAAALKSLGIELPTYRRGGLLFSFNAKGEVSRQQPLGNIGRESAFEDAIGPFLDQEHDAPGVSETSAIAEREEESVVGVARDGGNPPDEHTARDIATAPDAAMLTPSFITRNERRVAAVVTALVVSTLAYGVWWWFSTRVDRARLALSSSAPVTQQRAAMAVLADHVEQDEVFASIVDWFTFQAARELSPEVVAEISRAFSRRKPSIDVPAGFVAAVTMLQVRGQYAEARQWIEGYEKAPAVTDALLSHLERLNESEYKGWPGARDNLEKELAARPKDAATVDMALQRWLRTRSPAMLSYLQTFERPLVKARVTAAARTPVAGEDEWRLMACQVERCTVADVARIVRSARAEANQLQRGSGGAQSEDPEEDHFKVISDGAERAWQRVSATGARLEAQRRALVSIGPPAAGAILSLYYESSAAMWSFATMALIELDRDALMRQLQADISRDAQSAAKAILALQALPVGDRQANRLVLEALSSRNPRVASFALHFVRLRLKGQELVDGVLAYVSRRDGDLSVDEVETYKNALKDAGPDAGAYVANTMNRLLDSAGGPRSLPWIQKALVIAVLSDVGTFRELPVLGRLRNDRGGYVWVRTEIDDATLKTKEVEEEISFTDASDAAADAIRQRQ